MVLRPDDEPLAHDEKTRSGSLMRRIMGFHRAWVFERGSLGHSLELTRISIPLVTYRDVAAEQIIFKLI